MKIRFLCLLCIWTLPLLPQERFDSGELKGFTKSPTEHIIEPLGEQTPVRAIEGVVTSKTLSRPMVGVLVEVRGPGPSEEIRSVVTDRKGHFKFKGMPSGEYSIKITLNGFRSVYGRVSLQPSVKQWKPLRIEMLHGA
jgi:hypothetical protein